MATGKKTGGRTKGTPNRKTLDVIEKLEALDCDPISAMARLAMKAEADGDIALAARLYSELSPYTAPKRKAVEQTIKHEEELTMEEQEAQYQQALAQLPAHDVKLILQSMPVEERQALIDSMSETTQ